MGWNDDMTRSIHHFQQLAKWNVDLLQKKNTKVGHQAFEQKKCPTPYSIIKSFGYALW
jgi:ascorbate-specific PTS system EIIC-type component UlaA